MNREPGTHKAYTIDLQCPQCGAPVVLQETERIVACSYCRVRHFIVESGHPSYLIPPKQAADPEQLYYLPYWRFKGMAFALQESRVVHRLIDSSAQAVRNFALPFSLGLRSQTQRLKQITPETSGRFLLPSTTSRQISRQINGQLLGLGPQIKDRRVFQVQVGEIVSLIYTPLLADSNGFVDGLTGKRLPREAAGLAKKQPSPEAPANTGFLPALCPHCGWDLEGENSSNCLFCRNCFRVWMGVKGKLMPIPFQFFGKDPTEEIYLPFWNFRIKAQGLDLEERLTRTGRKFEGMGKDAGNGSSLVSCNIPAFKIHPGLFLRLSRQMSAASAAGRNIREFPSATYYPVTLPFQEGLQAVPLLLFHRSRNKQAFASQLSRAAFKPRKISLLFVPFIRRGSDLVQPELNIGLHKNALSVGRML